MNHEEHEGHEEEWWVTLRFTHPTDRTSAAEECHAYGTLLTEQCHRSAR